MIFTLAPLLARSSLLVRSDSRPAPKAHEPALPAFVPSGQGRSRPERAKEGATRPTLPPHALTEARRLRKAGWSFDGLARRYGVSAAAIRADLGEGA